MSAAYDHAGRCLSAIATSKTISERRAAAWHAARAMLALPRLRGDLAAHYECWRLLAAHNKNGAREVRLSLLDLWRVVVDACACDGVQP